jgi:hypothetical protein
MTKLARYDKTQSEYAAQFGVTRRAINEWIARGKKTGDLPPLDHTNRMADWWRSHMNCAIPEQFLQSNGHVETPKERVERNFSSVKSLSIEDNVEALRVTLAINKQLLDEALIQNEDRTVALRQRNYERCFNLLRLAEKSLTELQQQRGSLIDREKVLSDQTKIVETLKQMRERMTRDVMIELEKNCGKRLRRVFAALAALLQPAIEKVRLREELIFSRGLQE